VYLALINWAAKDSNYAAFQVIAGVFFAGATKDYTIELVVVTIKEMLAQVNEIELIS
jgi:hypothetical protein